MINFSFGGTIEMFNLDVEVTIGEVIVGSQKLSAPYQMAVLQCQDIIQQTAQDDRPMKIVFRGEKMIDLPNGDTISKPARVIFANSKYCDNFELDYK